MNKTKIDWCDSTWNLVTGCLHGCEYCYARGIANRFSGGGEKWTDNDLFVLDEKIYAEESEKAEPYPYGFMPTLHRYRLDEYANKKGRNIFVCSMADLFGEWVPDSWIEEIFNACKNAPQHNYLFLTKNPDRYVDLQNKEKLVQSNNMWYGASATNEKQFINAIRAFGNLECSAKTFLSVEPILEDITNTEYWNDCIEGMISDWIIIGAETGRRKDKVILKIEWIEVIVSDCRKYDVPLFMKSSLADILGEPLIQEFPKELRK